MDFIWIGVILNGIYAILGVFGPHMDGLWMVFEYMDIPCNYMYNTI